MRAAQPGAIGALFLAACAGAYASARGKAPSAGPQPRDAASASLAGSAARAGGSADAMPPGKPAAAVDVRMALPPDGTIGAWLVAGPVDRAHAPDEASLSPAKDRPLDGSAAAPLWRVAGTKNGGVLDVAAALDAKSAGGNDVAYAGGALHVERGGRHVLLLGVDDGAAVVVDGRRVFSHDAPRARRDDDDLVAFDLAPGDHTIVLSLHRFGRAWNVHARLLDPGLDPPPPGSWRLPGSTADDARMLLPALTRLSLDRGMQDVRYRPVLHVLFADGAPIGVPVPAHARLFRKTAGDADVDPLFDVTPPDVLLPSSGALDSIISLPDLALDAVEDGDWTLEADVGGHKVDFALHARTAVRKAIEHASHAIEASRGAPWPAAASIDSVEYLRDRLAGFVAHGDGDIEAQLADARELDGLATALDQQHDPYVGTPNEDPASTPRRRWRTGPMRRAYRSPVDGRFSEFAVYVPPDFNPRRTYPLIAALHGMNGYPMEMLMWLFGRDDPNRDGAWEDRHPCRDLDTLEAIVVAPDGHSNAMYRELGEDDVMRVVDWAMATYPVDPSRVTITGPSMGGIGSAACALHHPDRFAAAEPLCGYHSYFVRSDIGGRTLRPWERFIAEKRSNVFWAENGQYLPLYIVHGTKDLPEENSGVLIDRYTDLKYSVEHEHPELGHNVWQTTYEDLKGAKWLLGHRRPMHPRYVRFKTPSTRWGDDAWVHVRELASSDVWGEVFARADEHNALWLSTRGVAAVGLDRDVLHVDDAAPVVVDADGEKLTFQAGEPIELHRDPKGPKAAWSAGPASHDGPYKHGTVTGPIHDVFHEPILFVWGASDPDQARANEEVARAWARVRWGVRVDYPIVSDTEFFTRGEPLANDRALFLVGNAKSNAVVRALEASFPIRVDGDSVVVGDSKMSAEDGAADRSQLGAMFIRPNPARLDRYVVVVEGVGPLGTWRSLSLPEMLPDFVVYDEGVTPARGALILGGAKLRDGGVFGNDWSLPR